MGKILITRRGVPLMKLDGINIFIAQISDELIKKGYSVTIAGINFVDVPKYKEYFGIDSTPVFAKISNYHKLRFASDIEFQIKFFLHCRKYKYDFIIMNGIAFSPSKQTLFICHDMESTSWPSFLQRIFQKTIYGNIHTRSAATSTEIQDKIAILSKNHIHIIPTCIATSDLNLSTGERTRITHIGTDPWKNPLASLELFAKLNLSGSVLTFIGDRNDLLIQTIEKKYDFMENRIEFKSSLSRAEFLKILSESIYCLVPSNYKVGVLSPTVLDSYSQGTPVLASGISRDIFICGETGYCLKQDCLDKASKNKNWSLMSQNAFAIAKVFSVENSVAQILNVMNLKIKE